MLPTPLVLFLFIYLLLIALHCMDVPQFVYPLACWSSLFTVVCYDFSVFLCPCVSV